MRVSISLLPDEYSRIDIDRPVSRKEPLTIWQDGKGDLIVECKGKHIVDERLTSFEVEQCQK